MSVMKKVASSRKLSAGAHIALRAKDHAAIRKFHAEGVKAEEAKAKLTAGTLVVYATSPNMTALDGDGTNGCEVSVATDASNCGVCGKTSIEAVGGRADEAASDHD